MKFKILFSSIVTVLVAGAFIATSSKSDNTANKPTKNIQLESVNQELSEEKIPLNNSTNKIDDSINTSNNKSSNIQEMAGPMNSEYGIREDILRYIEKTIPTDNDQAKKVLIKYAAVSQYIYYRANKEEALKAITRKVISLECLHYFLNKDEVVNVIRGINKLMRNNPERDKHMWEIDEQYFGWKVIGNGDLSTNQVKKMCENGDF